MDENTLKLKLIVCTLTSQSMHHFKSKVIEDRGKTTTKCVTVPIRLELNVVVETHGHK
jgi:hypothetical protein